MKKTKKFLSELFQKIYLTATLAMMKYIARKNLYQKQITKTYLCILLIFILCLEGCSILHIEVFILRGVMRQTIYYIGFVIISWHMQ